MDRGNANAPIRDGWSRRARVLTVPGKSKCCFTDTDRSQRIRYDDSGQTARRAGALNCARSAEIAHFCKEDLGTEVAKHSSKHETAVVEERDLLSVAYKNAVDNRRAAWRVITSFEQKEKSKSEEELASYAREYVAKVENELQKIREGVLALTDKKLIPLPSTDKSKVLYYKMKSDYYRYFAECATDDAKGKATDNTCAAYATATEIAEKDLVVTNPVRLAMAQRQISMDQIVQKTVETPQQQCIDKVVEDLIAQVPQVHVVRKTVEDTQFDIVQKTEMQVSEKTVEISQLQAVEKIDEILEIRTDVGTQTGLETAPVCQLTQAVDVPVVVQRQVPSIETVQKTVEVPQTQHIDKVADVPVARPRQTLSVQRVQNSVEVPQIQFIDKLFDSHVNMRSVPEVEHVVSIPVTEHMASAPAQSHADVSAGVKSDITWTKELAEIRQMVEFFVRRERKLDAKTDVAVRRLERLEKEQDEQDDHDREASMTEALTDKTKVVKLVVDKWFVDRGFGFGKVPTGEIVFIHANAVVGAEVLTIGTDAWVQVVNDDARAQGGIEPDEPGDKTCGKQRRTKRKRTRWPSR